MRGTTRVCYPNPRALSRATREGGSTLLTEFFSSSFFLFSTLLLSSFWTSRGQRCRPSSPSRFLPSIFIAHRVQQSHCSSIFHRVSLTHALALSASQSSCAQEKVPTNLYEYMHSTGLELTKLTYARLEDNLIRHRGNRLYIIHVRVRHADEIRRG